MRHRSNRFPVNPISLDVHAEDMPYDPGDMPRHLRSPLDEPDPGPVPVPAPDPVAVEAPPRPVSGHEGFRPGPFDHERLDAYRIAREALVGGEPVAQRLPPEHAGLASQLRQALLGAQLGLAQAASRGGSGRGDRFRETRGEVARAAAALDAALALGLVERAEIEPTLTLLGRLSAMLVRLAARAEGGR
jgi:hypothetical protein